MGAAAGRPRGPSALKRAAVIAAARAEFIASGYHGASMDAITHAAGVSKATVYNHFTDKPALFRTVMLEEIGLLHATYSMDAWDEARPREALGRLGTALVLSIASPEVRTLARTTIAVIDRFPDLGTELYERSIGQIITRLERYLRRCTRSGSLHCAHPRTAATQLLGELIGLLNIRSLLGALPPMSPARQRRHVADCVGHFMAIHGGAPSARVDPAPGLG